MSAIANIVAFDGAVTPVSHTLVPMSVTRKDDAVVAEWAEQLTSLPLEAQVRVTSTKLKLKNGIIRTSTRVEVPQMETSTIASPTGYTAPAKVAFVDTIDIVSYANPRSTVTGRRLARQLALNIAGAISTSVAAATSGATPELIDNLISPT